MGHTRTTGKGFLWSVLAQSLVWVLPSFFLNLLWEVAHLPLYTLDPERGMRTLTYAVMHCTVGDTVVAFASYVVAAAALREAFWPARAPWRGGALAVIAGVGWTIYAEWYNVYVTGAWGYTPRMPTLWGVGVSPLLQWLALPALTLFTVRHWQRKALGSTRPNTGETT